MHNYNVIPNKADADASLIFTSRRYLAVVSLDGSLLAALDLGIGANAIGVDFDIRYNTCMYTRVWMILYVRLLQEKLLSFQRC